MVKFGLPDISIKHINKSDIENIYDIITFLINDLVSGRQKLYFSGGTKSVLIVPLGENDEVIFNAMLAGSEDDPDFNNYHLKLELT